MPDVGALYGYWTVVKIDPQIKRAQRGTPDAPRRSGIGTSPAGSRRAADVRSRLERRRSRNRLQSCQTGGHRGSDG